jgi:riboflavin synthase
VGNQAEGQVMLTVDGADSVVQIGINGDSFTDMMIYVKNVTGLTAGDFWL